MGTEAASDGSSHHAQQLCESSKLYITIQKTFRFSLLARKGPLFILKLALLFLFLRRLKGNQVIIGTKLTYSCKSAWSTRMAFH